MPNNFHTLVSEKTFIPRDNGLHWNGSFFMAFLVSKKPHCL